jgi:hypothetical protein
MVECVSYDLAVWEGQTPVSDQAALADYRQVMDRMEQADAEPPSNRIRVYVAGLLARWPDVTSPDGDDSPWADGPLINNASGTCIYFSMVWSRADEASAFAASLAAEHGLVCFDPQTEALRPESATRATTQTRTRRLFGRRKEAGG